MAERNEQCIDETSQELTANVDDAVLTLRQCGMGDNEIRHLIQGLAPAPEGGEDVLCGVPLSEVTGLTLDGTYWFDLYRRSVGRIVRPGGVVYITFKIAQAPGGKAAKFGIEQGQVVTVPASRVVAVRSPEEFPAS